MTTIRCIVPMPTDCLMAPSLPRTWPLNTTILETAQSGSTMQGEKLRRLLTKIHLFIEVPITNANVVTFTLLKTSTITVIHRFSPKNHQWDVSQSGWGGNSRCGLRGWRVAQALLRLRRRQHLDDDVHRPFLWIRHKPEAVFLQVSVCWKFSSFDLAITLLLTGQ